MKRLPMDQINILEAPLAAAGAPDRGPRGASAAIKSLETAFQAPPGLHGAVNHHAPPIQVKVVKMQYCFLYGTQTLCFRGGKQYCLARTKKPPWGSSWKGPFRTLFRNTEGV